MNIDSLKLHFSLSTQQETLFLNYTKCFLDWNQKVNLISRKDTANFIEHHLLYSLSLGKYYNLSNKKIIDIGTGGGLPGLPLAILFQNAQFTLLDSKRKKIKAIQQMVDALGLDNVKCIWSRAEEYQEKFHYVTGRAVSNLYDFYLLCRKFVEWQEGKGILYLKGGELESELTNMNVTTHFLKDDFNDPFFTTKYIVKIPSAFTIA